MIHQSVWADVRDSTVAQRKVDQQQQQNQKQNQHQPTNGVHLGMMDDVVLDTKQIVPIKSFQAKKAHIRVVDSTMDGVEIHVLIALATHASIFVT